MKNFLKGFVSAIAIILVVGCSSLLNNNEGIFGKAQKVNSAIDTKVRLVENAQAQSNENKLALIGAWSQGGVDYSLGQIKTNVPPEVKVAQEMNARVEAGAKPDFNEVKEVENIVDKLLSEIQQTRIGGEKALAAKDKQIVQIQNAAKQLDVQRENEIAKAFEQADINAAAADQYKATLGQMDSWFGLGAVFYGIKKFIVSSMWILGIGSVVFLILRLLASSNPVAGAIFSIFEQVASWAVHTIAVVFPKALSLAGNVSTSVFNSTKSALTTIVDCVETVKLQSNTTGKSATIEDLLNTAELSMTPADKVLIDKIRIELGWVKPSVAPTTILTTTPTVVTTPTTGSVIS